MDCLPNVMLNETLAYSADSERYDVIKSLVLAKQSTARITNHPSEEYIANQAEYKMVMHYKLSGHARLLTDAARVGDLKLVTHLIKKRVKITKAACFAAIQGDHLKCFLKIMCKELDLKLSTVMNHAIISEAFKCVKYLITQYNNKDYVLYHNTSLEIVKFLIKSDKCIFIPTQIAGSGTIIDFSALRYIYEKTDLIEPDELIEFAQSWADAAITVHNVNEVKYLYDKFPNIENDYIIHHAINSYIKDNDDSHEVLKFIIKRVGVTNYIRQNTDTNEYITKDVLKLFIEYDEKFVTDFSNIDSQDPVYQAISEVLSNAFNENIYNLFVYMVDTFKGLTLTVQNADQLSVFPIATCLKLFQYYKLVNSRYSHMPYDSIINQWFSHLLTKRQHNTAKKIVHLLDPPSWEFINDVVTFSSVRPFDNNIICKLIKIYYNNGGRQLSGFRYVNHEITQYIDYLNDE